MIPPWEDRCEWDRMTRMTGPDCAVLCYLINTHTHAFSGSSASSISDGEGLLPDVRFCRPRDYSGNSLHNKFRVVFFNLLVCKASYFVSSEYSADRPRGCNRVDGRPRAFCFLYEYIGAIFSHFILQSPLQATSCQKSRTRKKKHKELDYIPSRCSRLTTLLNSQKG